MLHCSVETELHNSGCYNFLVICIVDLNYRLFSSVMKLKNKWGEKNQTQVYTAFLQYLLLYDLINLDWGCTV